MSPLMINICQESGFAIRVACAKQLNKYYYLVISATKSFLCASQFQSIQKGSNTVFFSPFYFRMFEIYSEGRVLWLLSL